MKIRNGFILTLCLLVLASSSYAQRQREKLDRGVVAVNRTDGSVFVSWRLLGTDADDIAFNVYRTSGANLRDALTGEVIWSLELNDPGRGLAMDIDPRHPGYECWANNSPGLFNSKGERISETKPNSCNMGIWWDGDLLREILDGGRRSGAYIDKWNYESNTTQRLLDGGAYQCVTNNGTKANPSLCADILGDWREEVIWRTEDGSELRIFVSTIPTDHRLKTLMNDPVYRLSVAWQNVSYNQPAHPGFYFGDGMAID